MNLIFSKKNIIISILITVLAVFCFGIFTPRSFSQKQTVMYAVQKGIGFAQIGVDLEKKGIILNHGFFNAYAIGSLRFSKIQAGSYEISSSMSVAQIVKKMAMGDVVKNTVTIIEGWDLQDISKLFGGKNILAKDLEGYLFPDTYQLSQNGGVDELIQKAQANFDKKMTPELKTEIAKQKKTVHQIIIMASMIEKEVISQEDKKMVSGILWKRIKEGMPLQVDATINYITGKNDAGAKIKDTKIDSPYNTYKYYGLPAGPISNPGMDSILAAIYPQKSEYWYYLSATETGETIFSKTLEEQNTAAAKYLK